MMKMGLPQQIKNARMVRLAVEQLPEAANDNVDGGIHSSLRARQPKVSDCTERKRNRHHDFTRD